MKDFLAVLKEINDDPDAMEAAAKKLCKRRGYDPMDQAAHHEIGSYAYTTRPRWMNIRDELQEAATTILCLTEG